MRPISALGVLALVLVACGGREDAAERRPAVEHAADSLAEMPPYEAYRRGLALGEMQLFEESLPYFRRALEVPPPAWQPYCDYAISLFHATHQTRSGWTEATPATRSSYERVAMIREAMAQLDLAERLAQTAPDRAFVIALRARYLKVWGLAWDALSEYHRAATLDERHLFQAFELAEVMRDPVRAGPAPEPLVAEQAPRGSAPFREPAGPAPAPGVPRSPASPDTATPAPSPAPDTTASPLPSPAEPDTSNGE